MDATTFIEHIQAAEFSVGQVSPDGIEVSSASRLTDPQRQFIRQRKPELLAALADK
jgi:hypothetical protein